MNGKFSQWLNPLAIYSYLRHLKIICSSQVFYQQRSALFNIFKLNYEKYKYFIEPTKPSSVPLDIIIPVIEKDLDVLPYVIAGIRKHIKHPLCNIYIVAPNQQKIIDEAIKLQAIFVNEKDVCPLDKEEINFVVNGVNRNGWVYQQLLKLNFDKIATQERFLVVDADTIFVKDTVFEKDGKLYFDFSDEFHEPYYKALELLTGLKQRIPVSFVAHYMLFSKHNLQKLRNHIFCHTNKKPELAIISLKDVISDQSNFSEYETYANYCITYNPQQHRIRYWFNKSLNTVTHGLIEQETNGRYRTLSFHAYLSK